MRLQVDGTRYGNFVGAEAVLRLDALSRTFGFEATSSQAQPLPFRGGESCLVFADGEQILDGFIELVNVDGDGGSHKIDVQGRDRTADLLDSGLGRLSDLRAPISLRAIVERVVAHLGTDLDVLDLANPAPFTRAEDLAAPEPGENAFEFLEALARKRQVLLTSDGSGRLVISSATGTVVDARIEHRRQGTSSNNVLTYSVSYDSTGRFNSYKSISQLNAVALSLGGGDVSPSSVASQGTTKTVTDGEVRRGRQLVLVGESSFSTAEGARRASWEANIRRARGKTYSATVHGYRNQAGLLWTPNTLVQVVDDFAGINDRMLVNSVTFSMSEGEGRTTTLALVEKDAYTLIVSEPVEGSKKGLGIGLELDPELV